MRKNSRNSNQLRPVSIETSVVEHAEGSAMIQFGSTRVLCTASLEERPPKWLQGSGSGWVTAEYSMLPRSTHTRIRRDKALSGGRSQEISRLIARSLRAGVDMKGFGEKQIIVDCDVINADGGTRTAAITGGFVALVQAFHHLQKQGEIEKFPIKEMVSAVSVGLKDGAGLLDLCYEEDCSIDTDMNFVMVESGNFVEVQGTAEMAPFSVNEMSLMVEFAQLGCSELFKKQREAIEGFGAKL